MPVIDVHGVAVDFPFQPYAVQVEYMRTVIAALQGREHALLESPTGTGKTMCLLCSVLAWHLKDKSASLAASDPTATMPTNRRTIVYASRTHAQLAQVVREFKSTAYSRQARMAILGSREHLCVNHDANRMPTAAAINAMCNSLRAQRACQYVLHVQQQILNEQRDSELAAATDGLPPKPVGLFDIEDLVKEGRQRRFCPYFYERELAATADIVFCPYTYIFDPSLAKQLPFRLADCIVIVDEAHNVPNLLSGATSANLTALDTANAIAETTRAYNAVMQAAKGTPEESAAIGDDVRSMELAEDLAALKHLLCNIEKEVSALEPTVKEVVRPGTFMVSFLAQAKLTPGNVELLRKTVQSATGVLANAGATSRGLSTFMEFVDKVFDPSVPLAVVAESFRFVVFAPQNQQNVAPSAAGGLPPTELHRTLGYWCMDVAIAMQMVLKSVPQLILTSGTLSPMDHFAAEIGIDFRHVLQGGHVIHPSQLYAVVLQRGATGEELDSSFNYRNSVGYRTNLGNSIINLLRNSPDGGIVFFPSYAALQGCVNFWKSPPVDSAPNDAVTSLWGRMSELKTLFVEPRESAELPLVVREFQASVDEHRDGKGATLFAVARGKVSEGIDFADRHGRLVIVTGIPFANTQELEVKLKKQFLTDVSTRRPRIGGKLYTGDDWYRTEAMRAVNQCIGRVIRHHKDFGAVVLADTRFVRLLGSLSQWVRTGVAVHGAFGDTYRGLAAFFARHGNERDRPRIQTRDKTDENMEVEPGSAPVDAKHDTSGQAHSFALRQQQSTVSKRTPTPEPLGKVNSVPSPAVSKFVLSKARVDTPRTQSAVDFCASIKAEVSDEAYASFRKALALCVASVKDRGLSTSDALATVLQVLRTTSNADSRLREFEKFLPPSLQLELRNIAEKRSRTSPSPSQPTRQQPPPT
jgi:regulator of telomere elongation helicase 1